MELGRKKSGTLSSRINRPAANTGRAMCYSGRETMYAMGHLWRERVNIFGDFVQQAEFYIFHFGISGKSPSPFGAYRQHKRSLTNRFFLTTRLSKEKGIQ
ncbi:hypothetical protein T07_1244 [Trichinella nelsoni]|uniref:Uncharacterized protein n=1 Tax=Trichinella nelsoni TaxID=6336 RepID=A0A0V0SKM1_9BILA|nr:hypothetical protein T07_1244 [Trichinella nelsoni]